MARPFKYKTADDLAVAIDRYFDDMAADGKAPKWQAMLNMLNLSDDTIQRYNNNADGKYPGYSDVIKKAINRHSTFWQQYALDHPQSQTFCIFMLKQPYNGGLTDRQQTDITGDIKVKMTTTGGKSFD